MHAVCNCFEGLLAAEGPLSGSVLIAESGGQGPLGASCVTDLFVPLLRSQQERGCLREVHCFGLWPFESANLRSFLE